MSFDLYRPYLILDIPHSICPTESDRQDEYHLLNLVWIGDVSVLHSEPASLQTAEHSFDFPTPPIHSQRILEFEVRDHLTLMMNGIFCSIRKRNQCVPLNSRSARSTSILLIPRRSTTRFKRPILSSDLKAKATWVRFIVLTTNRA